jgi:UDP-N-acetylmuramyl pentapeptide phosphotransferase/UDP-N-acetylglucosamine-1-phosphate transferase
MAAVTDSRRDGRQAGATSQGRPELLAGSTEARPGIITTEFWLSLLAAAAVVAVSYLDDSMDVERGWTLGIALLAAYVISRGIAKAGSSERFVGFRDGR